MKKLLTVILIAGAATLFAETTPNQPPCECVGIGIPTPQTSQVKIKASPVQTEKLKPASFNQYVFNILLWAQWLNPMLFR